MNHVAILLSLFAMLGLSVGTKAATVQTVEEYNEMLPVWGTSWTPSERSLNGYNASFYTGFAPRIQNPDRIHVHVARGNQTRVTVILDENAIQDYLYDLVTRAEFYKKAAAAGWISLSPTAASFTPQARAFEDIIQSPRYQIYDFTRSSHASEQIYSKSLEVMSALNKGRLFHIQIDLKREFLRWKSQVAQLYSLDRMQNPELAAVALNLMVPGRVNLIAQPDSALVQNLIQVLQTQNEDEFVLAARDLFSKVTQGRYDFKVLNSQGQWDSPIQCQSSQNCFLRYTEFTAIYPTGSIKATTSDQRGNQIPDLALPGLWKLDSFAGSDVDNIRHEPYYGFIPKLDYEAQSLGLGFHNPAVRFYQVDPAIKRLLAIPSDHSTFWSVKRGGVSHGCSRLAAGHVWEMRHILPVEDAKMKRVYIFANPAQEFDIFDIDGDGQPEVMGVEYLLSYDLQDASNGLSREGQDLQIGTSRKLDFYRNLYGAQNVFHVAGTQYVFERPTIPIHVFADFKTRLVRNRIPGPLEVPLYEQAYEKDKVQFYDPIVTDGLDGFAPTVLSKRLVRLFGRIRGCAPTSNPSFCGAAAFEQEAAGIARELGKSL